MKLSSDPPTGIQTPVHYLEVVARLAPQTPGGDPRSPRGDLPDHRGEELSAPTPWDAAQLDATSRRDAGLHHLLHPPPVSICFRNGPSPADPQAVIAAPHPDLRTPVYPPAPRGALQDPPGPIPLRPSHGSVLPPPYAEVAISAANLFIFAVVFLVAWLGRRLSIPPSDSSRPVLHTRHRALLAVRHPGCPPCC